MRRLNPRKLHGSKWTARQPRNRERHFLVIECLEDDDGVIVEVDLEAVINRQVYRLPWQALTDEQQWLQGWK